MYACLICINLYLYQKINIYSSFSKFNRQTQFLINLIDLA